MAQLEALSRPAPLGALGWQLQRGAQEALAVVRRDLASVLEATARLARKRRRQRAPRRARLGRCDRKARVVPRQVGRQKTIGRLDRGDPRKTQLTDQAVLQCSEEPLDAAFGLR